MIFSVSYRVVDITLSTVLPRYERRSQFKGCGVLNTRVKEVADGVCRQVSQAGHEADDASVQGLPVVGQAGLVHLALHVVVQVLHRVHFENLLAQADLDTLDGLASRWLGGDHGNECDTSCNLCMRDFYNAPYHGLLDWRLALDMARLARQGDVPDLHTPWQGRDNPWRRLVDPAVAGAPVPAILRRLRYQDPIQAGALRVYYRQVGLKRVLIERHPLWTDPHPEYQAALALAAQRFPGVQIQAMNPFHALRRPAEFA